MLYLQNVLFVYEVKIGTWSLAVLTHLFITTTIFEAGIRNWSYVCDILSKTFTLSMGFKKLKYFKVKES